MTATTRRLRSPQRELLLPAPGISMVDRDGYLTMDSIAFLRRIDDDLRRGNRDLAAMSMIPRDTLNNWFYRRRKPAHGAIAFLSLLMMRPDSVIEMLGTRVADETALIG